MSYFSTISFSCCKQNKKIKYNLKPLRVLLTVNVGLHSGVISVWKPDVIYCIFFFNGTGIKAKKIIPPAVMDIFLSLFLFSLSYLQSCRLYMY